VPNSELVFATDSIIAPGAQNGGVVFPKSAADLITMKNILMQGPVSFGVYVNDAFFGYSSGVFDSGCGTQANHCVTGIGWGSADGQEYFQTINSWGSGWGDNGGMKVAPCVVGDYEYPGDFSLQTPSPTMPTPIPPPTPPPAFTIDGTGCALTEDGCVASANYPGDYDVLTSCTIKNMPRPFTVSDFNTESFFDKLKVGDSEFSGSDVLNSASELAQGKLAGDIEWISDSIIVNAGWKICPPISDSPTPAPMAAPTAKPTAPAAPTATPTPPPSGLPPCQGDAATWDAGYGLCPTYAEGQGNNNWCGSDSHLDLLANQVCSSCGACEDQAAVPTPTPTGAPTGTPTGAPTGTPTGAPTATPTAAPTSNGAMDLFDLLDDDGDDFVSNAEWAKAFSH
jgi:hypothetical protein